MKHSVQRAARRRRRLRIALAAGSATLLGCVVAVAAGPVFGLQPVWVYGLALVAAVVCIVSAVELRRQRTLEAVDESAWLIKSGTRDLGRRWDDVEGVDD